MHMWILQKWRRSTRRNLSEETTKASIVGDCVTGLLSVVLIRLTFILLSLIKKKKNRISFMLIFSKRSFILFALKRHFLMWVKALHSKQKCLTLQNFWHGIHWGCCSLFEYKRVCKSCVTNPESRYSDLFFFGFSECWSPNVCLIKKSYIEKLVIFCVFFLAFSLKKSIYFRFQIRIWNLGMILLLFHFFQCGWIFNL